MIGLGFVYGLLGLMFAAVAVGSGADRTKPRRWRNAAFWGVLAVSFLFGDRIGDVANGALAVALALVAAVGFGRGGRPGEGNAPAPRPARQPNRVFLPVLVIPVLALAGSLWLKDLTIAGRALVDPKEVTPVALAIGALAGLVLAVALFRPRPAAPAEATRSLLDQVGWTAVLPQMLAALGAVFALSGVGRAVGELVGRVAPLDRPLPAVLAYTAGMALFTISMGNAFAALPVMVAAVGAPVLIARFHGDPAAVGALGMLAGYCGTLVTPMAANFNVVPVALLGLKDRWAVIRVQAPTAAVLFVGTTALLYLFGFRR